MNQNLKTILIAAVSWFVILFIAMMIFGAMTGCEARSVPRQSSAEVERLLRPDLDQCCECVWQRCITGDEQMPSGYTIPGQPFVHELWTDRCVDSEAEIASTYFAGCVDRQCRDLPCGRSAESQPNTRDVQ